MASEQDVKIPDNIFLVLNTQLIPVQKSVIEMGRQPDNDLIISEPGISRNHAQLRYKDGQFEIHDLNSKNGTFVNGRRVMHQVVKSGDTVTLGGTPLLFIDRSSNIVSQAGATTTTLDDPTHN